MRLVKRSLILLCLQGLAPPLHLAAQTVELTLREDSTRAPVAGAIVRLVGPSGPVAQSLSSEAGRITLRAPVPGSYRIRIDRIGWTGTLTAEFSLARGEIRRMAIPLPARRLELPPLEVRGRSRCGAMGGGGGLAVMLWEEIGKALTANVITGNQRAVPLHAREFVREVDRDGKIERQWVVRSTITRGQPFGSVPPSELSARGFVVQERDSVSYAAPDARLLSSDEFVDTHCFRAVPGPANLIGLAFEPVPGRTVTDVSGALWVDRTTRELRRLDYRYVPPEGDPPPAERAGGEVEFLRLPAGAWIVSFWYIRMPRIEARTPRPGAESARLVGYLDRGGRAEIATDTTGRVTRALVVGRIRDSLGGGGLAGAVIRVRGFPDSVLSDATGRYDLAVEASGDQVVEADHWRLRLLGRPPSRPVLLSLGDSAVVDFAAPALGTLARAVCGGNGRSESGVLGVARRADGTPAGGLAVRVDWWIDGGVHYESHDVDRSGFFAACHLPAGRRLPIRLAEGARVLVEQPVRLEQGRYQWLELAEWGSEVRTVLGGAPVPSSGPAALTGMVRTDSSGRPLQGVEVVLEGAGRTAVTDATGRYFLDSLPAGSRIVLFRSVGFGPVREWVTLPPADTLELDARLLPSVVQLEPLVATARQGDGGTGLGGFEDRRRLGFGEFLDPALLRNNEHLPLAELLGRETRLLFGKADGGLVAVSRRRTGPQGEACYMQVVVDGAVMYRPDSPSLGGNADAGRRPPPDLRMFQVSGVEAIEVYASSAETPPEFGGAGAACGTLVIWTRRP